MCMVHDFAVPEKTRKNFRSGLYTAPKKEKET